MFETPGSLDLQAWSPNQQFLVYGMPAAKSGVDLWLLPVNGDRRPIPFLRTGFNQTQSQVSPNGRWIAYTSNESGGDEVYVESFPRPGSRYQVSTHGGVQPRWGAEGRELFYLASNQVPDVGTGHGRLNIYGWPADCSLPDATRGSGEPGPESSDALRRDARRAALRTDCGP